MSVSEWVKNVRGIGIEEADGITGIGFKDQSG